MAVLQTIVRFVYNNYNSLLTCENKNITIYITREFSPRHATNYFAQIVSFLHIRTHSEFNWLEFLDKLRDGNTNKAVIATM